MVRALHHAGLEVILDVVFNHTCEGGAGGPTLCFRGLDNPAVLPAGQGRPAPVPRHHRHGQLAERREPGHAAADHGLAAVLADRDARGRVPVRPGRRPWPARRAGSAPCRRSSTWLRRIPWYPRPSSSPSPGTWGRWTATISASSPCCGTNGTAGTGLHAGLLAQPAGRRHQRVRHPVRRLLRPVRKGPPHPVRLGQPDHGARRVHAAGPGVLRRQAKQANGEANRDGTDDNRSWNCGARAPRRTRKCWPCGPGSPGPY